MDKKGVVVISFQFSVVMKGIEKKLNDSGYTITEISRGYSAIMNYSATKNVFLIYLSDEMEKMPELPKIIETIDSAKGRMILIGEKEERAEYMEKIPALYLHTWLDRPVDIKKLEALIDGATDTGMEAGAKKRVLIVDDDPSYAKMVREWIKDTYRTDIVTAGMQAITFLLKNKVNLILLDYEMPVVDGPQVLQMLRQEPTTANIPVVFLTGVGSKESVARVLELKPDGYILKSTTKHDILNYLRKVVK